MKVSVICPYGTNSLISHIASTFASDGADLHLWATDKPVHDVAQWTRGVGLRPKAQIWNTLMPYCRDSDWVLLTDDDIEFPQGFLRKYVDLIRRYGVDMSAPALTQDSYYTLIESIAWDGLSARQINWVDQMIFGVSRRIAAQVFPVPSWLGNAGWGVEYFFDEALTRNGWTCAVFDELQVKHTFRPLAAGYSQVKALETLLMAFGTHSKLSLVRSQNVLKLYPLDGPSCAPALVLTAETQDFLDAARPALKEPLLLLIQKASGWALPTERHALLLEMAPGSCRSSLRMALFALARAQAAGEPGAGDVVEQILGWAGSPTLTGRVINLRRGVEDWYRWTRREPTLWHDNSVRTWAGRSRSL